MTLTPELLKPGTVVEVTQQIPQRDDTWVTKTRGTILKYEQTKTGAWFAHSRDDKLWLDRLTLQLDDGEIVELNLDKYSHIQPIDDSGLCEAT